MNIKQAKERFTLEGLLSRLGFEPDRKRSKPHDLWYASPFRPDETEPSFHIDTRNNFFKDFGQSEKGGDLIDFAKLYLKYKGQPNSTSNALQWLSDMDPGYIAPKRNVSSSKSKSSRALPKDDPYKLLSVKPIFTSQLFTYLDQRQIPRKLAMKYLQQVYFLHRDTQKKMFGLGLKMRSGGYDVRNTFGFKTTIGPKDITIIKGNHSGGTMEVYEGVMDFLTRLTIEDTLQPQSDTIILNSTNLYEPACDYIKDHLYSDITLWLDNDKAGALFQNAFINQFEDFKSRPVSLYAMNHIHQGYKDLNEWHVNSNLTPENKMKLVNSKPRIINQSRDDEALSA